jgi:hypothetical protein
VALIDSHDFGFISSGTKRATLFGSFTPLFTGLHTLQIENTSNYAASSCIYSYIDNISLFPYIPGPNLGTDIMNISCKSGGTVNFDLDAGSANAGTPYWLWMTLSGTYPGLTLSNIDVPLNYDSLFEFGLLYPGFAGSSGFLGTLDGQGKAQASLMLPYNHNTMLGKCIHFAYVLTSPGPALPITFASYPVHVKYIP